MNDHDWTRDYAATYLANGLDAGERTRLEDHIGGCQACAATLDETRAFDLSLNEIFAPVRPDPMLEDRVIRGLRNRPTTSALRRFWVRVAVGVAAVVTVGAMGAVVSSKLDEDSRPMARAQSVRAVSSLRGVTEDRKNMEKDYQLKSIDGLTNGFAVGGEMKPDAAGWKAPMEGRAAGEDMNERLESSADMPGLAGDRDKVTSSTARPQSDSGAYYSFQDNLRGEDAKKEKEENAYFRPEPASPPKVESESLARKDKSDARGRELEKKSLSDESASRSMSRKAAAPAPGSPAPDPKAGPGQSQGAQDPPGMQQRKIIRNGQVEYEIENFDQCLATIMKIVTEERGYVATVNSEKLENGKIRGEIVLRCPPENLDTLVLKLRGIGDLKGQKITSEDVTKSFYDTESRLRAARQMETRLLEIIKSGKGEIKDLLEAEKQLGEWRQKIEIMEGEIRYLTNMVSLCTLKVALMEKNIRTAASATETEKVSAGIEAEDVEKQYQAALTAVAELKGRITGSEMKRYDAGQYQARVTCEVSPENSGALRDRLKQLGNVVRLDVDREVKTDGTGTPTGQVRKEESKFDISIYNVINIAPRESWQVSLACVDAEDVFNSLLAKLKDEKSGARVVNSNLNRQRGDRTTGFIHFEVRSDLADAMFALVKGSGEVMHATQLQNNDVRNVTSAKKGYQLTIAALGAVQPRETAIVTLAAKNVAESYKSLQADILKAKGRILSANLNDQNPKQLCGFIDYEVRRDDEAAVAAAMRAVGDIFSQTSRRIEDQDNSVDSKVRMQLTLRDAANIPPKETWTITLESSHIDEVGAKVKALGRYVTEGFTRDENGVSRQTVIVDVPYAASAGPLADIKGLGRILAATKQSEPSIREGAFAMTRFSVTVTTGDPLIGADEGFWSQIKKGLIKSFAAIGYSIQFLIIGLVVILPLGLIGMGAWKVAKKQKAATTPT